MSQGIAININRLKNNENEIRRLARELNRIKNELQNIRGRLDWDIRNERGIDWNFSSVCNDVGNEERILYQCASFLADAVTSYQDAENQNRNLLFRIPDANTYQCRADFIPPNSWVPNQSPFWNNTSPFANQWNGFRTNPWLPYSIQGPGVYRPLWVYPGSLTPNTNYFTNNGITLNNKPGTCEEDDNISGDWFGYEINKPEGSANWDFENREVGVSGTVGIEGYVGKGEVSGESGIFSGTLEGTLLEGSAGAEAKAALFSDGQFDPELSLTAKAEATGISGSAEGQIGNDDNNVHGTVEGAVGTASAEATGMIGMDGVGAHVEAGAAVFQGEVEGGFSIFGVNFDASIEGEALSVGAEADFGVTKDEIEVGGKLSFLAGLGLNLKISW